MNLSVLHVLLRIDFLVEHGEVALLGAEDEAEVVVHSIHELVNGVLLVIQMSFFIAARPLTTLTVPESRRVTEAL
mgnify:CR=1 FL=1